MVAIIVIAIVIIIALILFWLSYRLEQRKKLKARNACYTILIIVAVGAGIVAQKTYQTVYYYRQATTSLTQVKRIVQKRANLLIDYSFNTNNNDNLQTIENTRRYYYNQKAKYYYGTYNDQAKFLKHANCKLDQVTHSLDIKHNEKLQALVKKDKSLQKDYQTAITNYSKQALNYNNLTTWNISNYLAQFLIKDNRHFPLLAPKLIKAVKQSEHTRRPMIL